MQRTRRTLAVVSASPKAVKKTVNKHAGERVPAPTKLALSLVGTRSQTDVNGSYTGVPMNKQEKPVQDADDL